MKSITHLFGLLVLLGLTNCETNAPAVEDDQITVDPNEGLPDDLVAVLNAHGGLTN